MATRLVRGACPHDCPDTCAMHVTVEDGRAIEGGGRPRPPDHGRLPLRKGVELPRPRLLGRAHPPPAGARGRRLPAGELGRGARPRRRGAPPGARRVRRRVDPAVQLHGHAGPDPGQHDVGARDERARRVGARADDLRHGRDRRHGAGARRVARGRSRGVAERPLPADLGLEPAVNGAAPLAQAARRAQPGRAARGGRPLPEPHGAARRRAPAPAAGHRRRARHRDDARDRRRRASTTRTGAGRTPTATTSCSPSSASTTVEECAAECGVDAETIARVGRDFASTRPVAAAARRGRPAPRRGARRVRHGLDAPAAHRRLAGSRRRLLVHPDGHRRRGQRRPAPARGPVPRSGAHDQHVPARRGAHRPGAWTRRSRRSCAGARTPPRSRPIRSACSRASAATTSSPSCSSSS